MVKDWRAGVGGGVGDTRRAGMGALGVEAAVSTAEVPLCRCITRLLTLSSAFQPASSHLNSTVRGVSHYLLSGFVLSWVG